MIPDLSAEIIPERSIAGITLGLDFDDFKTNSNCRVIKDYKELDCEKDIWLILYRNEALPWGGLINEIYCFWNKIVTLTFNTMTKRLEFIHVSQGYQGKLLGLLGIGGQIGFR